MVAKLVLSTALLAVIGGLASMGWRLLDRPTRSAPHCPAVHGDEDARAAIAAYDAINSDLTRGSMRDLAPRAALIANYFEPMNAEIAVCARRLAAMRDLAAARAEFARLSRLFVPPSAKPAATPPRV